MILNEAIKQGGIPDGYYEISVEFFQFKTEGDKLEGRLIDKSHTRIRGNDIGKYNMICGVRRVVFLGGVHLDELLSSVPVGSEIFIQYTHKELTGDKSYELKRFKVFVKATR